MTGHREHANFALLRDPLFLGPRMSLVSKVNGCGGITQNALPANKIFRAFSKALEKTWRKTNLHLRKNNNKLIIGLIC